MYNGITYFEPQSAGPGSRGSWCGKESQKEESGKKTYNGVTVF